jgi:NADH-quinone oxidoreductase subunit C
MAENEQENPIVSKLKSFAPDAVEEISDCSGIPTARVKAGALLDICKFLRDDPELAFFYLSNLCAVDYPKREKRFDIVYHIYSIGRKHKFSLIVQAAENEEIPSVISIWPTADWQEREVYDFFGIRFSGHPNLKRILLPDWWEGHPLRKDYPLEGRGEEQKVIEECLNPSKPKS